MPTNIGAAPGGTAVGEGQRLPSCQKTLRVFGFEVARNSVFAPSSLELLTLIASSVDALFPIPIIRKLEDSAVRGPTMGPAKVGVADSASIDKAATAPASITIPIVISLHRQQEDLDAIS
jgi:hypothetical protein